MGTWFHITLLLKCLGVSHNILPKTRKTFWRFKSLNGARKLPSWQRCLLCVLGHQHFDGGAEGGSERKLALLMLLMGRLAVTNTQPCFLELLIPSLPLIHLSTLKFDVLVSPSLLNISDALNPPALYCFLFCCLLIRIKSSMLKLPKNQTKICLYKGDNLPVNSRAAEPWESFLSWCLDTKGFPASPIRPTGSWMCK